MIPCSIKTLNSHETSFAVSHFILSVPLSHSVSCLLSLSSLRGKREMSKLFVCFWWAKRLTDGVLILLLFIMDDAWLTWRLFHTLLMTLDSQTKRCIHFHLHKSLTSRSDVAEFWRSGDKIIVWVFLPITCFNTSSMNICHQNNVDTFIYFANLA